MRDISSQARTSAQSPVIGPDYILVAAVACPQLFCISSVQYIEGKSAVFE